MKIIAISVFFLVFMAVLVVMFPKKRRVISVKEEEERFSGLSGVDDL